MRRLFWFGTGAGVGFGGAMWIRRRIRRVAVRYAPEHVTAEVRWRAVNGFRRVGSDVRDALSEGRAAKRSREAELRAELAPTARRG